MNDHRATLMYDSDCGFCLWTVGVVLRRDHKRIIRPVAIQGMTGARLLADLPAAERAASWHLVLADGRRYSRGAVVPPLLGLFDHRVQERLAEHFSSLIDLAYGFVANRRGALGSVLSRGARQRAEDLILECAGDTSAQEPRADRAPQPLVSLWDQVTRVPWR